MKNTFVDFELETGEVCKLTLTYLYLLQVKSKRKDAFEKYNKVITKGAEDEFDNIAVIYVGYLCGLVAAGTLDEAMTEEEFMAELSPDREYMAEKMNALLRPKKAMASEDLS